MITLNEAKNYLRVDHEEDDKLILQLLDTAKSLVKDVGRMDEEKFTCFIREQHILCCNLQEL